MLNQEELRRIETDWPGWAHQAQRPPGRLENGEDWATWLFLGGRGAGKTRAGAEWINGWADRSGVRLALVGPTLHDVREVMIDGSSGLRASAPASRRPYYEVSRRRLVWPNGAVAHAFSAEDPESLRGPQFHAAWGDEFCAWKKPGETLSMLRLGLRLGEDPRLMVTTTPKPMEDLRRLMAEPTTATTRAATSANGRNLSRAFINGLRGLYGGSRLEAQEIEGQVLDDGEALWNRALLDRCRRDRAPDDLEEVVVGLDPTASAHGAACGIVVVGRRDDMAWVLADRTVRGRDAAGWARVVAETVSVHDADWVVAETNQGGDMVEAVLKMAKCGARMKPVKAIRSKALRAAPVSGLYEQGRVLHAGPGLERLEEEMMGFGVEGGASPDRVDALVWAVTFLLLHKKKGRPSVRRL